MKIINFFRRIFAWIPIAHPENKAEYYSALTAAHKAYNDYASEKERMEHEKYTNKT